MLVQTVLPPPRDRAFGFPSPRSRSTRQRSELEASWSAERPPPRHRRPVPERGRRKKCLHPEGKLRSSPAALNDCAASPALYADRGLPSLLLHARITTTHATIGYVKSGWPARCKSPCIASRRPEMVITECEFAPCTLAGWSLSNGAVIQSPDFREQPGDLLLVEELFRPGRRHVGERRLVNQRRVHDTLIGQMLDDHVDELNLRRRRDARRQKFAEGLTNRCPVEPDNRADEASEALTYLACALDVSRLADTGVQQHLFEFAQIGWR